MLWRTRSYIEVSETFIWTERIYLKQPPQQLASAAREPWSQPRRRSRTRRTSTYSNSRCTLSKRPWKISNKYHLWLNILKYWVMRFNDTQTFQNWKQRIDDLSSEDIFVTNRFDSFFPTALWSIILILMVLYLTALTLSRTEVCIYALRG